MEKVEEEEWEPLQVELSPNDPRNKLLHKYNPLSRLFFCWIDPLFCHGIKHTLQHDDIYAHPREADSKYLLEKFLKHWKRNATNDRPPRLWVVIVKCLWWRFIIHGVLSLLFVLLVTAQSVLVGALTEYFTISSPDSDETREAYLLALGISLTAILSVINLGTASYFGFKLGMLVRVICTAAIYEKVLSISQSTVSHLTSGHILNLSSNDVHRFDAAFILYQTLWTAPVHVALVTYLVYVEIGPVAFLAILLLLAQLPLQYILAKLFTKLRLKAALKTDERIKIMNEVINGIKVIKMYGWEHAFHKLVSKIRKQEISIIQKSSFIRAFNLSIYSISLPTMMFVIFSVYGAIHGVDSITPRQVFTTFSLLSFVRLFSALGFVNAVIQVSEGSVALKRIEKFLLLPNLNKDSQSHVSADTSNAISGNTQFETDKASSQLETDKASSQLDTDKASSNGKATDEQVNDTVTSSLSSITLKCNNETFLIVQNLCASWDNDPDKLTLYDISFTVNKKFPLLAVVGAVGAGKSTLLQSIIGELSLVSGSVEYNGTMAYVEQEPWIFSATLRENILFGQPYDSQWYDNVVGACALYKDIDMLPDGDLTMVGERGVTLSGGQKARVSLARAVYRKADIYLLDDPLSAVDAAVSRQIFDECIKGLLHDSLTVLVTHQIQHIEQCDLIMALRDGSVSVTGESSMILKSRREMIDIAENDKIAEDPRKVFFVRKHSISNSDTKDPKSLSVDHMTIIAEEQQSSIVKDASSAVIHNGHQVNGLDDDDDIVPNIEVLPDAQSIHSVPSPHVPTKRQHSFKEDMQVVRKKSQKRIITPSEDRSQGAVSYKTYYKYFIAGGGKIACVLVFLIFFCTEGLVVASDWWISDWSKCSFQPISNETNSTLCDISLGQRIGGYASLVAAVWISCIFRTMILYALLLKAARVLHNRMFISTMKTNMLFFETNPIGRILNRFSKDIGSLDDMLIYLFCEFLQFFTRFLSIMFTAIIANPYLLIVVVFIATIFYVFRWYYLKTAREIKRLEAIARSPLYSHFSMTLQGLAVIRTCNKQNNLLNKFYTIHNNHTQTWYAYIVASRWFGFRIDGISSLFVIIVTFTSIILAEDLDPSLVGLLLAYAISLTGMIQYCIRQSTEIESLMISAERIISYTTLPPEESDGKVFIKPPPNWPDKGHIEIKDLTYRHSPNTPLVLRGINCTIEAGNKIGIVGRTGAGKSSFVSSLFRLAEPNGSIRIDKIECLNIGLHDVRTNMSIIPQDPVLFSGSVRYNLDPFNEYDDEKLWTALKQVQLRNVIKSLDGLETLVTESGGNFSVGQRQLFCLARALIRNNKILVLDEATANVDLETDSVIQNVIRESFSKSTVLTIAHRLDTVMDSDKIIVLRSGDLVEYDIPHELLCNSQSYLLKLVNHTGPIAAEKLKAMAFEAYSAKTECQHAK